MHYNFYISDPHFGHNGIINFLDNDGNKVRPFNSIEEHDETIIENCNKRVRSVDRLYIMGDVVMNRRCLPILNRLNGKKVLLKGNHDIFNLKDYTPYFDDIRAYKILPKSGIIFSHIPIHPDQLNNRFKLNCHGHLHQNKINDKRYMNLCCENLNYTPIELEEIICLKNLLF